MRELDEHNLYPWSCFLKVQWALRRIGRDDLADRIDGYRDQVEDMERRVLAVECLLEALLDQLTPDEAERFLSLPDEENVRCLQG